MNQSSVSIRGNIIPLIAFVVTGSMRLKVSTCVKNSYQDDFVVIDPKDNAVGPLNELPELLDSEKA